MDDLVRFFILCFYLAVDVTSLCFNLALFAGMVMSKVGKRHALTGFEALKELFISRLFFKIFCQITCFLEFGFTFSIIY